MKLTTAGESHSKALIAIIEGLPAHLKVDEDKINAELALRQLGYGRSARQRIEKDEVVILSGVRSGETLASPVTLCVVNKDYQNWSACMDSKPCEQTEIAKKRVSKVRPGHADLVGCIKYEQTDARNVLERASARETAIRVASGVIFKEYLSALGVEIASFTRAIYSVADETEYSFDEIKTLKDTQTGMLCGSLSDQAKAKIDQAKANGDTLGGVVEIRVKGLKSGFGSMMTYSQKLDARLAGALMGIQAVKGVEVGAGFALANEFGSQAHDEIAFDGEKYYRQTNRAGGIEGGTSNGEEIVVKIAMKPIPTLAKGLKTVDILTKTQAVACAERSDVCAVFSLGVIAEAVVAEVLATAVAERLGGDTMAQVKERYDKLP
ncbi:MAG: chorismate synthase [Clostridiales bacterium]|nr:chorismate synthase [Clostridiales bacterium]